MPDISSLGTSTRSVAEWLSEERQSARSFTVPDADPAYLMPASDMHDRSAVFFGKGRKAMRITCDSREQAELLLRFIELSLRGSISLPANAESCADHLHRLEERLAHARAAFESLAESRGGNDKTRAEVIELLMHWFVHGRERKGRTEEQSRDAVVRLNEQEL
jgi:hypothetical protein